MVLFEGISVYAVSLSSCLVAHVWVLTLPVFGFACAFFTLSMMVYFEEGQYSRLKNVLLRKIGKGRKYIQW